jgi:hypothetical protein
MNTGISEKKETNNLVDVAKEPIVRIIIAKDVAVGTNIAKITHLAATIRENPKSIWRSKI